MSVSAMGRATAAAAGITSTTAAVRCAHTATTSTAAAGVATAATAAATGSSATTTGIATTAAGITTPAGRPRRCAGVTAAGVAAARRPAERSALIDTLIPATLIRLRNPAHSSTGRYARRHGLVASALRCGVRIGIRRGRIGPDRRVNRRRRGRVARPPAIRLPCVA